MHLVYLLPMVDLDTSSDASDTEHATERQISHQELRQLERERGKMTKWIERHHKNLLKGSPIKGSAIEWTENEDTAFQTLKKALISEPVLRHPRMGQPFIIDPDSSQYYIGAVLQQTFRDPDGHIRLHPIAYESKKLTATEQRYSAQERELLAAKYSLSHWRHTVKGSEIHIHTDHASLSVYRQKKPMTRRLGKFMEEIEHG